jgi:hypothetical protein
MAHTPEQRDQHALCGAKKRSDGKPCRKFAGEGTDHFGVGRCKLHGGSTRTHRAGAVAQEARQRAAKREFGQPLKVLPGEALMEMLWISYGQVAWLQEEINKLADLTTFEARVLIQSHKDERDRTARVAATALDAGVAERQVRLAEMYGEILARLIRGLLGDLKLTADQQQRAPQIVQRHLIALEGEPHRDGKGRPDGARPRQSLSRH